VSDKGAAHGTQSGRLPKLKRFESASDTKNCARHESRREWGPDQEGEREPKDDVQGSARIALDPQLCRAHIQLGSKAEGDDDRQKLQKRAAKLPDAKRHEKDPSVLLEAA